MKRFSLPVLAIITMGILFFPPATTQAFTFNPNNIISTEEFMNPFSLDLNQIQSFLQRGALGNLIVEDWKGRRMSPAEIIWRAAQDHMINPKALLVLLQKEQSLVEDEDPTQKQLDWATGYAVCDDCAMDDPAIQRWKGFGKQVNSAAMQFTDGYIQDMELYGTTQGIYGPGVDVEIDGQIIVPENEATAALYAYTPHIHGNSNFALIWQRWFTVQHPTGSLIKSADGNDVYLIEYGYKRKIENWSTFISRFNPDMILEVSETTLLNYPDGRSVSLPNYALLEDEQGDRYLLVDDILRPIPNQEVFRAIGFVEDEILSISNEERSYFAIGDPLTATTSAPTGALLRLTGTDSVFFVQDGVRHIVPDIAVQQARFSRMSPVDVEAGQITQYTEGEAIMFPDGYLVKSDVSPVVYIISEGRKRPIANESAFLSYGWSWTDIITTSEYVLSMHETGIALTDVMTE